MLSRGQFLGFAVALTPVTVAAQSNDITCGAPYAVGSGDTLSRISIRAYGVSAFEVLYEANRATIGDDPNRLVIGQALVIPCRGATEAAVTTTEDVTPQATVSSGPIVLTVNKVSDPRFVINVGIMDPYLELIEIGTEGRVRFVAPTEMNRDPGAQFDLVTSGQVDVTYVRNETLADTHPLLQLPMVPLMGGSAQQTAVSLWNLHDKYLAKTDYFDQAHLLGFIAAPTAHIWRDLDAPVQAGEDILSQNAYAIPYFEGLDTLGPPRVQADNAAKYGDADGTLTFMMAHGAARGAGIWNSDRGVTEVENGIYTPTFSVIMSNEAWARISPADQEIINQLSGLTLSQKSAAWDDFDNGHRQIMLDTGLVVNYPDGDLLRELEEAAQEGIDAWSQAATALGVPAEQAIASYRANLASLRYLLIFR